MMWKLNEFKNNIAVISEDEQSITYSELFNFSQSLMNSISKRCLVFSLCTNSFGSLLGYVTFLNNKVVPLMIDADLDINLLHNLISIYKPDYLWVPKEKIGNFTGFKEVYCDWDYCLLKTKFESEYELNSELALLLTTSGSTGSFKLVRQSYNNISSNMNSIAEYLELDETERAITVLPMHYTYGLSVINSHLSVGASLILTRKTLMQKDFWTKLKNLNATSMVGVPYTYEMLDKLRFFRMDLPNLKTITQAGGKLPLSLHKKFAKYALENNKKFIVMYGQTEATARMSYLPYEKSFEKAGSIGIAIPGGKFFIIDSSGNRLNGSDKIGELVYEGPNVTLGYAECGEDLNKSDERNGILLTGDMAKVDDDGFYYIVGRKKRFLKIFGSRVNLDEIEQLIRENFKDVTCACCGVDDCMYIFINNAIQRDAVLHFISKKTGINHTAFKVKIIKEIPRNESGKILYPTLEEYYD